MVLLWIGLGLVGFLALAVLITAYVCYRMMYKAPKRDNPGPGEYRFPEGEVYTPFREDIPLPLRTLPRSA